MFKLMISMFSLGLILSQNAQAREMTVYGIGKNIKGHECRLEATIQYDKKVSFAHVIFDQQGQKNAYHNFSASVGNSSALCAPVAQFTSKEFKIAWVEKINENFIPRYLILSFDGKNFSNLEKVQFLSEIEPGYETMACVKLSSRDFLFKNSCIIDYSIVNIE